MFNIKKGVILNSPLFRRHHLTLHFFDIENMPSIEMKHSTFQQRFQIIEIQHDCHEAPCRDVL